jgi:hypothetical protein
MYSLVWQSVIWRPGKLRFLIGVNNPLPIPPAATASQRTPLRRCAVRQIRDFSRANALLSSRIRRRFLILIAGLFSSCLSRTTHRHK